MTTLPVIMMTTRELASKAYMGDKIYINGVKRSYFQIRNMKGKSYTVSVERDGAINILKTVNNQTVK